MTDQPPSPLSNLYGLGSQLEPRPWRKIVAVSIALHLLLIAVLKNAPIFAPGRTANGPIFAFRQPIPVYAPVLEPSQNEANKEKLNRNFDVESLKPRPTVQIPESAPSTTRPAARTAAKEFVPPPERDARAAEPKRLAEPPKLEGQQLASSSIAPSTSIPQAPSLQIQASEKPKLSFEAPGADRQPITPSERFKVPDALADANRGVRPKQSGGLMVGDAMGDGSGGLGEGLNLPPAAGKTGSNLELLSDPMGVDFRPYLIRVLSIVRRNWFAVIPESARIGIQRGRVIIQFAISRQGQVPKLVISVPSGSQPLDRAAVAGVSASNPLPPLPQEFKGEQIRLQFTFSYNMPK